MLLAVADRGYRVSLDTWTLYIYVVKHIAELLAEEL